MTAALASPSSPQTKRLLDSPPSESGVTITDAVTVFSAFTTRASGNAR
jgi:hypothetical protein